MHCLDAPFLKILPRAAVPGDVEHLGAGFFGSQLYFSQASGDLLEFDFPPLYDDDLVLHDIVEGFRLTHGYKECL